MEPSLETSRPKHTEQSVRGGYDRWASVYDHEANPLVALEGPVVRAAVGEPAELSILDLSAAWRR